MSTEFPPEPEMEPLYQIHAESIAEADLLDPSVICVVMPEWVKPQSFGKMPMTKGIFYRCGWSHAEREKVLKSCDFPDPVIINGVETWTINCIWEWLKTKDDEFDAIRRSFFRRWLEPIMRNRLNS